MQIRAQVLRANDLRDYSSPAAIGKRAAPVIPVASSGVAKKYVPCEQNMGKARPAGSPLRVLFARGAELGVTCKHCIGHMANMSGAA